MCLNRAVPDLVSKLCQHLTPEDNDVYNFTGSRGSWRSNETYKRLIETSPFFGVERMIFDAFRRCVPTR